MVINAGFLTRDITSVKDMTDIKTKCGKMRIL